MLCHLDTGCTVARFRVRTLGFSLVELVIVIVIIGIVAAIAVPRVSRGAKGAADAALIADLRDMRQAIDLYAAEHGGLLPEKKNKFVDQMTKYSDSDGTTKATKTTQCFYGPYLKAIPPLPVGSLQGDARVADGSSPAEKSNGGWWYNENTGEIRANLGDSETDESGTPYNQY